MMSNAMLDKQGKLLCINNG